VYEQLVEREKRVKGQEVSVSTALGERERALQARQDQLALELQDRERRLRSHEDKCLATDRQLTADKAALDRARQAAALRAEREQHCDAQEHALIALQCAIILHAKHQQAWQVGLGDMHGLA